MKTLLNRTRKQIYRLRIWLGGIILPRYHMERVQLMEESVYKLHLKLGFVLMDEILLKNPTVLVVKKSGGEFKVYH